MWLTPAVGHLIIPTMDAPLFEIGADGIDVGQIVGKVQESVSEKMERGVYADSRIARAERTNLQHIRDSETFFDFYVDCLREAVFVDISDFEISERRRPFKKLLVALKRTIWNLLKFYTYRLWSQQNQVNGLLLSAVEDIDGRCREKIRQLEQRVAKLESPDRRP